MDDARRLSLRYNTPFVTAPRDARIVFDRLSQGPGRRFENAFDDVMAIAHVRARGLPRPVGHCSEGHKGRES